MFQQLEAFVRETGKVTLTIKMTGAQMSVVVVPCGDSKEAALRQPLVLTATPAELDEGFAQALHSFEGAHRSLAEQVSATTEILQAAEKSQAGKAHKALSKGSKAALPAPASQPDGEDDDADDAGERGDVPAGGAPADPADPAAKAGGDGKTDLFALL
ncbi:PRTRC genetic system protein E [Paraburkholderia tropica]|uniref:PRTRC system protein E n=1 Tax=Paraburkholderia tropica TaxID=92647 RepID=UPI0016176125|nr:PRTRC system protein E [Paraburkholderia tropica]MBB2984276.1 PRTRC genetic system protein E [Paraburkholderia tropica]MBB3004073.1 PRTRC genetic system protein E [Paraburkholderia tropica]MBB6323230.1 PRTRC genetic system protein E [Paraburkholderia tropica]